MLKPFRGASVFTFSDVMMFLYPYSSQIDPLHFVGGVGQVFNVNIVNAVWCTQSDND